MTLVDCGVIFTVSFVSAALNLFVEWFFIYSSPDYKKREEQIESAQKNVDRIKETTTGNAKKQEKRLADAEARLRDLQQKQSMSKMWSMLLMPVFLMSVLSIVNSMYQGHAVARLPFEPFGMLQRLSHRGLMGSDMQECSVTFFYVICSMSIRTTLQKFFGMSTSANPFGNFNMFQPPK